MARDSGVRFALSLIPQVDYDTPLVPTTAPKNYEMIIKNDRNFFQYTPGVVDNKGFSTGTPYATERRVGNHDTSGSFTERMSSQRLGRRLYASFGKLVTAQIGATAAYTHTFTPLNPQTEGDQLPVYTAVEKVNEDLVVPANQLHNADFPSLLAAQFSLDGSGGDAFLNGTTQWQGSGKIIIPSVVNFDTASKVVLEGEQSNNNFRSTSAQLALYPNAAFGGTVQNINCDFRDFKFSINNNPLNEDGYLGCAKYQNQADPESGAVRGALRIGEQDVQIEYTILMTPGTANTFNPYGKAILQTEFSSKLVYTGGLIGATVTNHSASFNFARQTITAVQIDSINGLLAYRVTAPPIALGQVLNCQVVVTNNVSSYTTLV